MARSEYHGTEIAVVGMAGRFPGAADLKEFWRNLRAGIDPARRLSPRDLAALGVPEALITDPDYVPVTAQMPDLECFDAPLFGLSDDEAGLLDPQQRILLELAWEALESAGYQPGEGRGLVGVFVGATLSTYLCSNLLANPELCAVTDPFQMMVSNAGDALAPRISYKLDLKGPSLTVQTACSTSLVAIHLACASLLNGECDMALAGAASINVSLLAGYHRRKGGTFSASGSCRAFDAEADGLFFGHGGGVVVLKPLSQALADRDSVRAVILGSAINNDGSLRAGFSAPSVEGQAEVLTEAWAASGIDPETLSYIEAHGTGTLLGDSIEIQALTRAFRRHTMRRGFCALGAVKSSVGHLDVAAGIAGLIKTVLCLEHGEIPPTLHFERRNPEIDLASSPVRLVTELTPWPTEAPRPYRAGINSFGLGGTNAHVVLEEAPASASAPSRSWDLLVLSAQTAAGLERVTTALATELAEGPARVLSDVAFTLQVGRRRCTHRRAVVCHSGEDVSRLLREGGPDRVLTCVEPASDRDVALLLPGAARDPRLGEALYREEPAFRRAIDECAEVLAPWLGGDLRAGLAGGPAAVEGDLMAFVNEYALCRLLASWGLHPAALLGQGIGQLAAACFAGVWSLADALALAVARRRGGEPPGVRAPQSSAVPLLSGVPSGGRPAADLAAGVDELWRHPSWVLLEIGAGDLGRRALAHPAAPLDGAGRLVAALPGERPDVGALLAALARLWLLGVSPDWMALHGGARRRVPLPTYPFERRRYWVDTPRVPQPLGMLGDRA